MKSSLKVKSYALFQFFNFVAIILLMSILALVAYNSMSNNLTIIEPGAWFEQLRLLLVFHYTYPAGAFISVVVYGTMAFFILSWGIGLQVIRVKDRNLLDTLFLLFVFIPLVSNLFALFAQLSTKEIDFANEVDEEHEFNDEYKKLSKIHRLHKNRTNATNLKPKASKKSPSKATGARKKTPSKSNTKKLKK